MKESKKKKSQTADAPFHAPDWPASEVKMWPLEKIKPYEKNARSHPREQIIALSQDMKTDGVTTAILVDEDGVIIAGHGRRLAAETAGFTEYPVMVARNWTDLQKRAARLKDNIRPLMAGWNEELLKLEVGELKLAGYDLPLLSLEHTGLKFDAPSGQEDRGRLLELVNVTIGEPKHQVSTGQRFALSGRHTLLCCSVISDWPTWAPLLKDGGLFCPYPGVFVPFSTKAVAHALVMVQPDPYIAGHILDRYAEVNGKKAILEVK